MASNSTTNLLNKISGSWHEATEVHLHSKDILPSSFHAAKSEDIHSFVNAGRFDNQLVLDGQFLRLEYSGELKGQPYTTTGMLGINKLTNEFVEFWADSHGNVYQLHTDTFEVNPDSISLRYEYRDPMSGRASTNISTYSLTSDGRFSYKLVSKDADGKETVLKAAVYSKA